MWADDLSEDDKATVAFAIGRIGELVATLELDHVGLVATLVDPHVPRDEVRRVVSQQVEQHLRFDEALRRIAANLQAIEAVLQGATLHE